MVSHDHAACGKIIVLELIILILIEIFLTIVKLSCYNYLMFYLSVVVCCCVFSTTLILCNSRKNSSIIGGKIVRQEPLVLELSNRAREILVRIGWISYSQDFSPLVRKSLLSLYKIYKMGNP